MAMNAVKTLVVFEDDKPDLEGTAQSIGESLDPARFACTVKAASAVTIPDILAASCYFWGAAEAKAPSYAEIARVLKGINLAGRKIAFFGASGAAIAWLREMVADSELSAAGPDYVSHKPEAKAISVWLRSVSS